MEARYLFNSSRFLALQGNPLVIENQKGISTGRLAWFKINQDGYSPLKAPFGSIEISGPYSNSLVYNLLEELDQQAKQEKLQSLKITHPPDGYDSESAFLIGKALQQHSFQLLYQDLNFHLEVKSTFKSHLRRSERWKLNKSKRLGFRFESISKPDWETAFNLLEISRSRKGFKLSMTREALESTFAFFPTEYQMFGVEYKDQLVALAITILVNPGILYVFYTADDLEHRKFSPVVLLHEGIYDYCLATNIALLDLGTASLKGLVNSGVATFKRNLGGIASLKNTFLKRY